MAEGDDPAAPLRPAAPATPATGPDISGRSGGWRALPARLLRNVPGAVQRRIAAWSKHPYARVVQPGLLMYAVVGASVLAGAYVVPALATPPHGTFTLLGPATAGVPGAPGADVPGAEPSGTPGATAGTPTPAPAAVTKPADLAAWAAPLSAKLGIPLPAMQAYGYAELAAAASTPSCQLRWTTLAGIGKVESAHGQAHASLAPDGTALPPIIGAPLDGQGGRMTIPDTDGGKLDLDRTWDHAVGPMQFIPSTWAHYGTDADGNGVADINNVNDAALAAARYLCAGNRNLSVAGDWWAAIMSYNAVQAYVRDVFDAANDYGVRSR